MKTKGQKGFTLVEVAVAALIGAVVILATGMALVTGHIFFSKAVQKVNLQRDASDAMLRISRSIKAGNSALVEEDGKAIKIYREGGWIRFSFEPETYELRCEIEGQENQAVINDNVEYLQFNVEGNKVTIDLWLNENNLQNHFVTTVMMRNYGG